MLYTGEEYKDFGCFIIYLYLLLFAWGGIGMGGCTQKLVCTVFIIRTLFGNWYVILQWLWEFHFFLMKAY